MDLNSPAAAVALSVKDYRYCVRMVDPAVARALCRVLDSLLLCLSVLDPMERLNALDGRGAA